MPRYSLSLLLAGLLVSGAATAFAHTPYLWGSWTLTLPDGTPARLRLLYGDGILGPDPVRPVVITSEGKVVALGPRGYAAAVSCQNTCTIFFQYREGRMPYAMLTFDAATMRTTGTHRVSERRISNADSEANFATEAAKESYGFRVERIRLGMWPHAAASFIADFPITSFVLACVGLMAGWVAQGLRAAIRAAHESRWIATGFGVVIALLVTTAMFVLWVVTIFLSSLPGIVSLVPIALGAGFVLALMAARAIARLRPAV
jgi:hypothetical protein